MMGVRDDVTVYFEFGCAVAVGGDVGGVPNHTIKIVIQ